MTKLPPAAEWPWRFGAVVFDLDGVLIDTELLFEEAATQLLARRGLTLVPHVAHAAMGTPAVRSLQIVRDYYRLPETVEELGVESWRLFWNVFAAAPAPLLPGVLPLLDRLQDRAIPYALATSSGSAYVRRVLEPHRILERFAFVLTCDDVRHGKPAPDIYEKAATRFDLPPPEMIVVEDSPNGLRSAQAAGARCVVVPHERVPPDEIGGADAIVPSLAAAELYELLGL